MGIEIKLRKSGSGRRGGISAFLSISLEVIEVVILLKNDILVANRSGLAVLGYRRSISIGRSRLLSRPGIIVGSTASDIFQSRIFGVVSVLHRLEESVKSSIRSVGQSFSVLDGDIGTESRDIEIGVGGIENLHLLSHEVHDDGGIGIADELGDLGTIGDDINILHFDTEVASEGEIVESDAGSL